VLVLTDSQLNTFSANQGLIDSISGDLNEGVNYFTNIQQSLNVSVFFGQSTNVYVVFYLPLQSNPKEYTEISYDIYYYIPSSCIGALSAFVFGLVGLIILLLVGNILYKKFFKRSTSSEEGGGGGVITDADIKASMPSDSGDASLGPLSNSEKDYHYMKKLIEGKNSRPWVCRPAINSARKPMLPCGISRPKYDFAHFWLYNHPWLSLCFTGPDSNLNRFSKLYLVLTLLMARLFMLSVTNEVSASTSIVIASSESATMGNLIARYLPDTLLVYMIEAIVGILYEQWMILKEKRKIKRDKEEPVENGNIQDDGDNKSIGGFNIWKLLSDYDHIIVLSLFTLAVVITTLIMLKEITCELFWKLIIGLLMIEFYKGVFPGALLVWCWYLFLNTWGGAILLANPWSEEGEEVKDDIYSPVIGDEENVEHS